jgi:hypothetical protein
MSMFGRNWLNEGFYEEDSWGDLTRIEDKEQIIDAQKNGKLYRNDGYSTDHINENDELNLDKDE